MGPLIVQQIAVDDRRNRALCGKSMKLGTQVYHPKTLKLRTSAVADLALRGRGSDFHIWLPCPQNLGLNGLQILLLPKVSLLHKVSVVIGGIE